MSHTIKQDHYILCEIYVIQKNHSDFSDSSKKNIDIIKKTLKIIKLLVLIFVSILLAVLAYKAIPNQN